ncbi:MAG: flavodoxin family protein [Halanaerobium sp.]|nr:flavodoxin family protein [Halanaerobium sp.]
MEALGLSSLPIEEEGLIGNILKKELASRGWGLEIINLAEKKIECCVGCGACGSRTPGRCIRKDDMQEIIPKVIQCDLLVFLTPVSFGSYSSELKKAIDRFMVINRTLYTIREGELHHQNRYTEFPSLLTIGVLSGDNPEQERIFCSLTRRNGINFTSPDCSPIVIQRSILPDREIVQSKIVKGLVELEMVS